uniref:Oligosaccharyltransferase complex subunit n=1 Tax=Rhinopithecus bieti TaxID=61621 RepID=A0A2K6M1I5_RHIBE
METLYRVPFLVLKCPNLKLKKPPWLHIPLAITMYALVKVSYFLITGGIIYDVIVETPSVGSMTDEYGYQRPVAFLAYRLALEFLLGIQETILLQYFFSCCPVAIPIMFSGIFFLVFHFLLHIYNYSIK